uniref:DNA-directed RNA polymerase subunit beta n=1 Tax=Pedobesia claviformis TaxID=2364088 RepID=A0A386B0P9_9CHLO|nr:RNA polymerase b-subunit [Pedobesia claviformis]AYC65269.1 RNA polymerase b-subunit [Pedobesia claviformis]
MINNKLRKIKFHWICLGNLPIMTDRGHFIINGSPRIIVNQLIRAEGLYYRKNITRLFNANRLSIYRTYFIDVISKRGVWIRFEINRKRKIFVCLKKTPKIPLFIFLHSIGFTNKIIFHKFSQFNLFNPKYIYQNIDSLFEPDFTLIDILEKFINIKNYDLGIMGRRRLNQKLNLNIEKTILTPLDILKISELLLNLYSNRIKIDDIDNLNNRRIRTIGEFLQIQIQQALARLHKNLIDANKKYKVFPYILSTRALNSVMKEFFNSCALSQFLDQVNPLSELTHKRRISALGPNGVKQETAGMEIRNIHTTYFGRVCPIETPEGKNAGLVNSLTVLSLPNNEGFLESVYIKVYKGQLQFQNRPIYISSLREKKLTILPADIKKSKFNFIDNDQILVRYNEQFTYTKRNQINLYNYSPFQLFSVATSVIPFFEHNDANRILMGSNMQRQALPLLISDSSNIRTGLDVRVISDTGSSLKMPYSGVILYTSKDIIHYYCGPLHLYKCKKKNNLLINLNFILFKILLQKISLFNLLYYKNYPHSLAIYKFKNYPHSLAIYKFKNIYLKKGNLNNNLLFNFSLLIYKNLCKYFQFFYFSSIDFINQFLYFSTFSRPAKFVPLIFNNLHIKKIKVQNFEKTNQGTFQLQKPIISTLEWLYKGDLIADCATSENGKLALGKNLLVAYIPWNGLNFEDAIIINNNLLINDTFLSLHIEKYEIEIKVTDNLEQMEKLTNKIPVKSINVSHLDKNGIIEVGTHVTSGTILVGKVLPIQKRSLLPHEKLLYEIIDKKTDKVKDTSLYAPSTIDGRVLYISINDNPYLNYKYNTDDYINEVEYIKISIYIAEKRNLQIGDKLSGRYGNKGVISKILPQQDLPFLLNGEIVDIVLNPLGVPSRMNVGQLLEALLGLSAKKLHQEYQIETFDEKYGFHASRSLVYLKLLDLRKKSKQKWYFSVKYPGKMFLFDGRTGEKFLHPTTIGQTYILKLVHMVEEKIHARATGPYSLVTQQPLKGRAKHGGQRFGEMEVWALEGFGSAYILHEILTIKSDDLSGREKITESILNNTPVEFGTPESFKLLLRELQSLCLNFNICDHYI